jgi:hypothetical protein
LGRADLVWNLLKFGANLDMKEEGVRISLFKNNHLLVVFILSFFVSLTGLHSL